MERFSQRESILLGYSPQNSFINSSSSPSTSQKSSDVDFHDVFGGPPKRSSSIHDQMRYSFNDVRATNRIYKGDDDEEEEEGWSGKPVFGEESLNRSRTHSDDFFDDIFKGSSSVSSSPRRVHRGDPYSSSPGSRVLSPARPLPPKSDSALLPVQFSLPAKLNKAVDTPPSISSITRTTSLSRFSSQALQGPESLRSDIRSSHRMSYLSQDFSVSGEGSSNNGNDDDTTQSNFKEDSKSSVSPSSGNPFQFHFSIYKWASSKPMVMPLRGRSGSRVHTTKNEEKSSTCESADDENMARESPISTLPNVSDQLLADSSSSTLESNKQENDSLTAEEVHVEPCQIIKDTIRPVFGSSETFSSLHSTVENDVTCDTASSDWPKKEQNNISCQTSADLHHKPDLKPIHSLIFDDDFGRGTAEKAKLAVKNSSVDVGSSKNTKNQNVKRSSLTNTQVDKAPAQSSPRRENLGRNKFKGKVKDFVKMFSHEVSSKAENDVDFGSQRFKKKEKSPVEPVNEEATIKTPPILQEELINSNVKKKIFTEASIKTTEDLKQCEKEACEAKTAEFIFNNVPEQYVSASSSGSVSNSSKANIGDTDGSFHENFQIEELTQEEKTPPEVSADLEEIQAIDAKIRQWSKGKEGNIRSLLTTVQHILWPGSGWKTVPLVDIIEGNAVKRSYQRALLCLHPDKLQQKGATSQQKYIAEKVFDILQEAWDHFNSLGPL